jgi:hypothetical protein
MREVVGASRYVATTHAVEEMEADGLTTFDVEHCILTGKIIERQRDRQTGERKYMVEGRTLDDEKVRAVVKLGPGGKLVFITVYLV